MLAIHELFTRHRLEWTSRDVRRYSDEMVLEFFSSYVATLRSQQDRWAAPAKHASLDYNQVRSKRVDISLPAICRYLYGEDVDATKTPLTTEFDYWWKLINDGCFQHELELRETTSSGLHCTFLSMVRLPIGCWSPRKVLKRLT